MNEVFLQLKDIAKSFEGPGGQTEVLKGINLEIEKGRTLAIVGPSGCGKSTLLNILGLLDKPNRGEVILEYETISSLSDAKAAAVRNTRIGFVFQMHHLLPQCSVLDNALIPTLTGNNKTSQKELVFRAAELLERVGLKDRMDHRPGQLSAGQRQRVAIVRALINKPSLLLADEPTGALDGENAGQIAELLMELNRQDKVTLILATHSRELASRMERQYQLSDGLLKEVKAVIVD